LGLVTKSQYASAVWGVLIPTILTPIIFGPVFDWRQRRMEALGLFKPVPTKTLPMNNGKNEHTGHVNGTNGSSVPLKTVETVEIEAHS